MMQAKDMIIAETQSSIRIWFLEAGQSIHFNRRKDRLCVTVGYYIAMNVYELSIMDESHKQN